MYNYVNIPLAMMHGIAKTCIMCNNINLADVAETVLIKHCVKFNRFLVNSKSFKIKLNYELVDDDGENWKQ